MEGHLTNKGGELRLFDRVLFSDNEVVDGSVSGSIGTNKVKENNIEPLELIIIDY